MVRVFTAGGIIIDNVVAADGRVGRDAMGGNAVYSAAGARLWLDEVGVVGRIPSNYPPELLRRLSAHGIDISGIVTVDEEVREAEWFLYRADGSRADHLHAPIDAPGLPLHGDQLSPKECRTLEAHLRAMPATWSDFASFRRRNPVRIEDVPVRWSSARGVHLAANQPASQRAMAEALFARGLFVTADPGPNAQAIAEGGLSSFLAAVTAFLPSEKELAMLAPGLDPASGLASLRRRGAGTVVVKLGADGAMVATGKRRCRGGSRLPDGSRRSDRSRRRLLRRLPGRPGPDRRSARRRVPGHRLGLLRGGGFRPVPSPRRHAGQCR